MGGLGDARDPFKGARMMSGRGREMGGNMRGLDGEEEVAWYERLCGERRGQHKLHKQMRVLGAGAGCVRRNRCYSLL